MKRLVGPLLIKWYLHTPANPNVPQVPYIQPGSNILKNSHSVPVVPKMGQNWSKLVHTCPNMSKHIQTCPNLSKLVQTFQTCPNLNLINIYYISGTSQSKCASRSLHSTRAKHSKKSLFSTCCPTTWKWPLRSHYSHVGTPSMALLFL